MRAMRAIAWILAAAALVAAGCRGEDPAPRREPAPAPKPIPVEIIPAPPAGEVQEIVRAEIARAKDDGRRVLVYVGASWCEPCQRFHQAAQAGQVDALFPGVGRLFTLTRAARALAGDR